MKYHKAEPPKALPPDLTATIGGFGVTAAAIPNGCIGMAIYIDAKDAIRTENNVYSYACGAGIYAVKIAYYDLFGEGEKSEDALVTVKVEIDSSMIANEAISLEKVDAAIKEKLASGEAAEKMVRIVSDDLNNPDGAQKYTALTQLSDAINLRVKAGEVINQINVSPESVLIDGKKVHITGDTYFDDNIVTPKMIQAGAVTAEKMDVDKLSSISAEVGTLRGGSISGTEIVGAKIRNASNTFSVSEEGVINGVTINSGTINANVIYQAGYKVKASAMLKGRVYMDDDRRDPVSSEDKKAGVPDAVTHYGGMYLPLPFGFARKECVWGINRETSSYRYSSGDGYNTAYQHAYLPVNDVPYVIGYPNHDDWLYYWAIGIR